MFQHTQHVRLLTLVRVLPDECVLCSICRYLSLGGCKGLPAKSNLQQCLEACAATKTMACPPPAVCWRCRVTDEKHRLPVHGGQLINELMPCGLGVSKGGLIWRYCTVSSLAHMKWFSPLLGALYVVPWTVYKFFKLPEWPTTARRDFFIPGRRIVWGQPR